MNNFQLDVEAYLHRIACERPQALTAEALEQLTRAHLERVPFENLQVVREHRDPSLEPEDLFRKVVIQRQGGWCFELNKLFQLLLEALGYDCRAVGVRTILGRSEPRPIAHRATVVTIDGTPYYCDVGLGGLGPKGVLNLEERGIQTLTGEHFRVSREEDQYLILRVEPDREIRMLLFRNVPYLDVDFNLLHGYYSYSPKSPFSTEMILYRCLPDGWLSLVDRTLSRYRMGVGRTWELEPRQVAPALAALFGPEIPDFPW